MINKEVKWGSGPSKRLLNIGVNKTSLDVITNSRPPFYFLYCKNKKTIGALR